MRAFGIGPRFETITRRAMVPPPNSATGAWPTGSAQPANRPAEIGRPSLACRSRGARGPQGVCRDPSVWHYGPAGAAPSRTLLLQSCALPRAPGPPRGPRYSLTPNDVPRSRPRRVRECSRNDPYEETPSGGAGATRLLQSSTPRDSQARTAAGSPPNTSTTRSPSPPNWGGGGLPGFSPEV